ncbi:MAG TPA: hypothetical protein VGF55_32835, partial [Gemmataceae bacterium]
MHSTNTPVIDRTLVVGVFRDREDAGQAVAELRRLGFTGEQVGVIARNGDTARVAGSQWEVGAAAGAVAGGATGTVLGFAVAAGLIPGVGPFLAGGILAGVAASAATGAVAGSVLGALVGLGIPEEEAAYYHGEFQAGRTIVTVRAGDRVDIVRSVMARFGGNDALARDVDDGQILHTAHPQGGIASAPVANPPTGKPAEVEMTDVGGGHV